MTGPDPARDTDAADAMPPVEPRRAPLAATVQVLPAKTDVPARVKLAASDRLDALQERPQLVAVIVAGAGALRAVLAGKILRRRC